MELFSGDVSDFGWRMERKRKRKSKSKRRDVMYIVFSSTVALGLFDVP